MQGRREMTQDALHDHKHGLELRRLEADLEIRQAELQEKRAQRETDTELKRTELELAAGRGLRFTTAQASVAAAILALIGGAIGGIVQAWVSRDVAASNNTALIEIEKIKANANIALDRQKFETSLITKATESGNPQERIRNLRFYLKAGFLTDPDEKIANMNVEDAPSSPNSVTAALSSAGGDETVDRLLELFGPPAKNITSNCGTVDSEVLKPQIVTENVANFRVTLLKPVIASLKGIISDIQKTEPDLMKDVVTEGGLCVRYVRGSAARLSTHAFGTALDISFAGPA
jgi:hypothetical protein